MNISGYDNWKLATPDYTEMVSDCCGTNFTHDYEYDDLLCETCGNQCEEIWEDEYRERERMDYEEMMSDERRINQ